jgi:glycosyltransferase involved in cell wall biosynthesis
MNYWLLTTEFPPIHGGGISTYCWHTAKMLSEAGHSVTVFVNDYSVSRIERDSPINNVDVVRFCPNQVAKAEVLGVATRLSIEFANIVELEMEQHGVPDLLETQDYMGIGYYTLQKKQLLYPNFKALKVVMTMHAPGFLYFEYNQVLHYKFPDYWIGEMEKASIRMADLVVSPSQYLIDELTPRMNLLAKNPLRIFNPYLNEWTAGDIPTYEEYDLVFFGKLTPQKGGLEMLSYLKKMWDNGFDKRITIIGGGQHFFYPMQSDMIDYVKEKYKSYINKGLICFEGNMPPELLKERLKKAHVIIVPSIVDNLPYAVLEAMAMGKLVMTSSNGGHTEILKNGISGFIFEHTEKNSFEDVLNAILAKSKEELILIAKEAQRAVEKTTNYATVYSQKMEVLAPIIKTKTLSTTFDFIEVIERSEVLQEKRMGENGLLSVVIPYYNLGDYLEDTLKSLEKVNFPSVEVVVVNDGSSEENSIQKLLELEAKYKITVYHKENEGLSLARNFGAAKARGEFLAFLDADDMVSPDYYKRAVEVLKQYENVSFVGCWAQYFGESSSVWPTFNPEPPYLLVHNMINSSALIYKKADFISFGKNDPALIYGMEDYDSVIAMVKNGARGVVFPELWWHYRIRSNSMAQAFNKNKELYLYSVISKKHSSFFQTYGNEVANLLNQNGPGIGYDNPTWPLEGDLRSHWLLQGKMVSLLKKNNTLRLIAKRVYRALNK